MKLPLKHIVILVIIALTGIFAYQTYWLTGLYHTMTEEVEQDIIEAMRLSDYNEMMIRVERLRISGDQHGEVSVTTGCNDKGKAYVQSNTILYPNENNRDSTMHSKTYFPGGSAAQLTCGEDSSQAGLWINPKYSDSINTTPLPLANNEASQSSAVVNNDITLLLKDKSNMVELATYFQQGIHAGIDALKDPDLQVYDSLLTLTLRYKKITLPHRTIYLRSGSTADSAYTYTDTLGIAGDSSYMPSPEARRYQYSFDLHASSTYLLLMEPITLLVLKQMGGILATSFVILIILLFAFWYLIRTILRQKTMEEMAADFTNNITHELKTPIAVAYAANDALLNFNQAEEKVKRDKYLRIGQEQLQQLSELVEQILSMSMERRKTFRLLPERIELKPLLEALMELHKLKAGKPIHFVCHIEPEDCCLMADRTHFSNILSNLIDNAVKYSFDKAEITIHCQRHPEGVLEVSVSDRGIGIAPEKQKHIFDKFYRVPTGNLHNVKGYGLGLYYVRTMVEKHGGTVSVESVPGQGSKFRIVIKDRG